VIRKGTEDRFSHEVDGEESDLTVRFDPSLWVSKLDLRPFIASETCDESNALVVCQGQTELSCAEDGSSVASRDCVAIGQVCLANQGCSDELILDSNTEAYRSLAIALTTAGRPHFTWNATE
jgi:hypothetical protein